MMPYHGAIGGLEWLAALGASERAHVSTATATGPGKIILLGEHAVVYNHPAIAIPVDGVTAHATVHITDAPGIAISCPDFERVCRSGDEPCEEISPFVMLARKTLETVDRSDVGIEATLASTIPIKAGMGSGAALSVALVRAIGSALGIDLPLDQVIDLAYEAEKVFHGNPSGIDNSVVAHNEPIYFRRACGCKPIHKRRSDFSFLIADSGVRSSTLDVVSQVATLRDGDRAHFDALFWEIGSLACYAREVIVRGTPVQLGLCMNRNHELLREITVSSDEIDTLVEAAWRAGAAGAKVSGAGRGGNVVVLLDSEESEERVRHALLDAGACAVHSASLN